MSCLSFSHLLARSDRFTLWSVSQVSVPKDLVAVMSAVGEGHEVDAQDKGRLVYRFRQPVSPLLFGSFGPLTFFLLTNSAV